MLEIIADNVQGFALGQNEITNYRTLGSVAANCLLNATLPAGPSAKPLVGSMWQILIKRPIEHESVEYKSFQYFSLS